MPIMLRSSVGPFDDSFMQRLPRVERSLMNHGLAPSQFTILRDRSLADPPNWDYTIVRGDLQSRLTLPDDRTFLNHVEACCRALDDAADTASPGADSDDVVTRLLQWIELLAGI